jgi:hypothetical protein
MMRHVMITQESKEATQVKQQALKALSHSMPKGVPLVAGATNGAAA